jgi:hypothetical protein
VSALAACTAPGLAASTSTMRGGETRTARPLYATRGSHAQHVRVSCACLAFPATRVPAPPPQSQVASVPSDRQRRPVRGSGSARPALLPRPPPGLTAAILRRRGARARTWSARSRRRPTAPAPPAAAPPPVLLPARSWSARPARPSRHSFYTRRKQVEISSRRWMVWYRPARNDTDSDAGQAEHSVPRRALCLCWGGA